MTNLIRGHIYQLKKDRFFYGCLGIGLIFLAVFIRIFLLGFTSDTGMTSMMQTFLGGDMVLYAFMVLAANIIAEVYRSGAMKNIVGRGISKKNYYLSMVFTISGAYVLVMLVLSILMDVFAMSKYGMGTLEYPAYFALSIVAKILFVMAHISFAVTMAVLTQNVITGAIFGFLVPYIPQAVEMVLGIFKIHISLDFIKLSAHMPSVYEASNQLSTFLPCFLVAGGYLILSFLIGFQRLKGQDIK